MSPQPFTRDEIIAALRQVYLDYKEMPDRDRAHPFGLTDYTRCTINVVIDDIASRLGITADEFENRPPQEATEYKS